MMAAPGTARADGRPADTDAMLQRLSWGATIFCLGAAVLSLAVTRNWRVALGVLGGGLLVGISLVAIRSSVDALVALLTSSSVVREETSVPADAASRPRASTLGPLLRVTGRYALLALLAYVMIARLRLHPIGLLIGASSLVASAALEAVRVLTRMRRF